MFRLYSLLLCFYLAFASPTAYALGAAAEASAVAAAARAAAALGAGEGLGVAALGLAAAAVAVGAFALGFCATSYVMGTDLCTPNDPSTGGSVSNAINEPAATNTIFLGGDGVTYSTPSSACGAVFARTYDSNWQMTSCDMDARGVVVVCARHSEGRSDCNVAAERKEISTAGGKRTAQAAGDAIASNSRATSAVAAAAASKARGATDQTAVTAARAAAEATGTGNTARNRAAGNTAAAAAAAAAAAEAAGASPQEIEKAAKDAANTAAAAADKAQPQEKTCQSNGASIDGRFCTDTAVNPDTGALPVFCQWATSVCEMAIKSISAMTAVVDFFDWTKKEATPAEREAITVESAKTSEKIETKERVMPFTPSSFDQNYFSFNAMCPAPATGGFELMGSYVPLSFDYQPICNFATGARPFIIAGAMIAAAFIVAGANRDS